MIEQFVIDAINIEREYQDRLWHDIDETNSIGDFLCFMQNYLDKAREEINDSDAALRNIRKVSAIGIKVMEKFGIGTINRELVRS